MDIKKKNNYSNMRGKNEYLKKILKKLWSKF